MIIIVILSVAASPVLAADICSVLTPDACGEHRGDALKQTNKDQSSKTPKVLHSCCEHHVADRYLASPVAFNLQGDRPGFVFVNAACSPFGERPPLAPPKPI